MVIPPRQLAHAKTVNPKNTGLMPVNSWISSIRLIMIAQIIESQPMVTKNEYTVKMKKYLGIIPFTVQIIEYTSKSIAGIDIRMKIGKPPILATKISGTSLYQHILCCVKAKHTGDMIKLIIVLIEFHYYGQ